MAVLPFRPTPFFGNKNRAFWQLQLAGWGGAMLLRAMSALANDQPWSFLVLILIASITGFSISLILSVVYRSLINRRPLVTWGLTAIILPVAVSAYAFIDSWVVSLYRPSPDVAFAQRFLGVFAYDLTLLGAWSALYYAINYFLQVEEQNDQMLRLEAQATAAQLAMLRYQLNPHFLFNTLNSISTLVLLKQTEQANQMLSRLSSFLRYTLINDPTGRVTLAQEIETLKLYLDIERTRFEERLRTRFEVQEEAKDALLPSLLLQPLVENAIKYAVTPQEYGAEIAVAAQLDGPVLRIIVSDTGPGLRDSADPNRSAPPLAGPNTSVTEPVSTGVGLANIRDRLAQAYGEEHRFEIQNASDGGFAVVIELPFEKREATAPPPAPTPQLAAAG